MSGLQRLVDTTYGPFSVIATRERADAFLDAIGDDVAHDPSFVHPMFANAVLFAAAPSFLDDEEVRPFTTSLIHSEQTFEWHRPIPVETPLEVHGTVEAVRARGALNLVTFGLNVAAPGGVWLTGSSVFLMSEEAAGATADAGEPAEEDRPPFDTPSPTDLPAVGEEIAPIACGASRADLARYAAASGDRNPIHLDHDSARSAGLEGVIVHGLLMAAWLGRVAGRYGALASMKTRFRNPLRPAVPATVTGSVAGMADGMADIDLVLTSDGVRLVTARTSVTR